MMLRPRVGRIYRKGYVRRMVQRRPPAIPVAVRVKVSAQSLVATGLRLETAAVLNSGFEVDRPEILLPPAAAEKLGLWPDLPPRSQALTYGSPGSDFQVVRIPQACAVGVDVNDRSLAQVEADVVIAEGESEVLLSDTLVSALHLVILDARAGEWCFRDQLDVTRASAPPTLWKPAL